MKKIVSYTSAFAVLLSCAAMSSCEGEKDLIIIDGNLPIKTSTLYMVGDATPNGWSIDSPTPLIASENDPLIFGYEGVLNTGEMKLCLTTGSWDAPFIRPVENGAEITRSGINEEVFDMHAGDPDNKWRVVDAGIYNLRFDLRNWTFSVVFVREQDAPEIEPIQSEVLYMVGDATPNGWNIDNPTQMDKKSDYIYSYEGPLTAGEMKFCTSAGSWDVPFVRPASDGCEIGRNGVDPSGFVYTTSPDNKWKVIDPGIYKLTLDLENWTIAAEYVKEIVNEKNPIETETLYMIGDATPGGWSMDDATVFTVDPSDKYLFTWEGELVPGSMKACIVKDGTFSCPFIRPTYAGCEISRSGVASGDFVFTTGPDDQWRVIESGVYKLTFNLWDWTVSAEFKNGGNPGKSPIETETLYMIGDATPGGWSMDDATVFTVDPSDKYLFTWEGELVPGSMKACIVKDGTFSCPFIRPTYAGCEISRSGVASGDFVFTTSPDDQWRVIESGVYKLTFNLRDWTVSAEFKNGGNPGKSPIETETLYMIGDATPGGWSMDDATVFTVDPSDKYLFTWEGELVPGSMKACIVKDGTFSCPFIRPTYAGCEISRSGVASNDFVFTTGPDDKWQVTEGGRYRLTFNLKEWTIMADAL